MKLKLIYILVLMLLLIQFTQAQLFVSDVSKRGTTAASFLTISQGARAAGMGSAFVAVADDPSAMFWNVAGIARLENRNFLVDHTEWFAGLNYNYVAGTVNLGNFGTLGLSLIASDYGEMGVTTVLEPEGTGESFTVNDIAFSVAWAVNLTDNFSIGFNPKIIHQSVWKMSGLAFAIDMGVIYNTPFDGITLGMSINNFGSKMGLDGQSAIILYDPDKGSTGNNDRIPAELTTDNWDLPLLFRVGLSYKAIDTYDHKLNIALDASHPNNDYESVNVGGEYTFANMVSLRAGYKTLFLKDSEESFTLGVGFRQRIVGNINMQFDYSYADFDRLGNTQKFSVSVKF